MASGPGYDYLQRAVPFHDTFTGRVVNQDLVTISAPVSHLVSADSELAVPGSVDRDFGGVRIPRPDATEPPVCRWRGHAPVIVGDSMQRIMEQVDPDATGERGHPLYQPVTTCRRAGQMAQEHKLFMKKRTEPTRRAQLAPAPAASPPARAAGEAETGFSGVLSRRNAPVALVLALLVVVSYFPVFSGGFIWDDVIFVEEPLVHSPSGLWNIWFSPSDMKKEGHYWPLVYTSFWLEHKLWGLAPAGYHAVNILLHLINVLLLWRLLVRLAVPGALVIAAVFAVHPVHVESVAWIIERKDVLSALFYLSAALAWVRFTEAPRAGRYMLVLVLFAAGLLSKSVVVTLPVAFLIRHWWQWGRVTRRDLLRLAPFFVVGVAMTLFDLSLYRSRAPLELGYTLVERLLMASRALWFYVGKLLWPVELAVIYPLWEIDVGDVLAWLCVLAAVGLAVLLWLGRRRFGRGPLAGGLFFAVTLGPVLGFVDHGYMQFSLVADRFQYLAGIGVLALLIGAAAHGVGKLPRGFRLTACGLAVVVVGLLGVLTWRQAGLYRDEVTFFSHIVALNPEARSAHLNLSNALLEADQIEEALAASRIAVEQRPDSAKALVSVGYVLIRLEQLEEAEERLLHARRLDPRSVKAHHNLAEALRKQSRYEEALAAYRAVLEIDAGFAPAHAGMGIALFQWERYEEAIAALGQAVDLQPELPVAGSSVYVFLGRASQELGRPEAAADYYERAVQRHPRDREALDHLAMAWFGQQRYEEALDLYRTLVEINPDNAQAHSNLGATLYHLGRHEEALQSIERALALDPDLATARTGLEQVRKALRQRNE